MLLPQNYNTGFRKREFSIDFIRGIAVFLMILAHSIYFFHNNTNGLLTTIERSANALVFTLFLFVSGTSSYLAYISDHTARKKHLHRQIFVRSIILLSGYYITCAVANVNNLSFPGWQSTGKLLYESVFLINVPKFTEFLLPFIFFSISMLFFRKIYRKISRNLLLILIISALSYITGMILYPLEISFPWDQLKALFAGDQNWLRYPVFQYTPVFLLGIYWGNILSSTKTKKQKIRFAMVSSAVCLYILLLTYFLSSIIHLPILNPAGRWPPTIGFLTVGTSVFFLLYIAYNALPKSYILGNMSKLLNYMGRDSFDLYLSHMILLFFYERFIGFRYQGIFDVVVLFTVLLVLSIILSSLDYKFSPSIFVDQDNNPFIIPKKRFKKRYLALSLSFIVIVFLTPGINQDKSLYGDILKREEIPNVLASGKLKELEKYPPELSINRKWFITGGLPEQKQDIIISLEERIPQNSHQTTDDGYFYEIYPEDIPGKFTRSGEKSLKAIISPDSLKPGKYGIQIYTKAGILRHTLKNFEIYVSAPVIVTWTLDWEGWDIPDSTFSKVDQISNSFGNIPITQFFNPRIFTLDRENSPETQHLLSWINSREENNHDEIGMHIHMFYDMVSEAGVSPRKYPRWGYNSSDGYDTLSTSYTREEFGKILDWSLNKFIRNGLGVPMGYRAGGWYINPRMFETLTDAGFVYDSSGRDSKTWNSAGGTIWNLNSTSQPYYPSEADINSTGEKSRGILEIPNNGGNSYEYEAENLIRNFKDNYDGGVQTRKVIINYLSHPQWADREFPRIRETLDYAYRYDWKSDKGPVIFTTLYEAYLLWK